jgi:anti-anti-sigma factor
MAWEDRGGREASARADTVNHPHHSDADGPSFGVHLERVGRTVRMRLVGEFDVFAEQPFLEGLAALGDDVDEVVVDLTDLDYCAATAVRVLNQERMRLVGAGVRFVIRLGDGFPRRLFGLLGLERAFLYEDW